MYLRSFLFCLLWLGNHALICAQNTYLSGIGSRWSDSFVEWELYCFDEDTAAAEEAAISDQYICGSLQLRWLNLKDDWSEWDFQYGDLRGTIKRKWRDDPTHWELRTFDGTAVTMRTLWGKDLREWRITDNDISLELRPRWGNQYDEWVVDDRKHGSFKLYTRQRNDPRDWDIEDGLGPAVSTPIKLALMFLGVYHGSPKQ